MSWLPNAYFPIVLLKTSLYNNVSFMTHSIPIDPKDNPYNEVVLYFPFEGMILFLIIPFSGHCLSSTFHEVLP